MKKSSLKLIMFLVLFGVPSVMMALAAQNIWITVSISEPVNITLTQTNWNIGARAFSFTTNRATPSIVSNGCNANISLALYISTEAASWTGVTNIALNKYVLTGLVGTNQTRPANGDYVKPEDVISGVQRDADATSFGNATLSAFDGSSLAPASKRRVWLKYETPASGVTAQQTIRITVIGTAL